MGENSGTFHTPNFPDKHPNNIECIWNIHVQPGRFILLSFDVFELESYKGKCIDIVEVKDGGKSTDQLLGEFYALQLTVALSVLQHSGEQTHYEQSLFSLRDRQVEREAVRANTRES